MSRLQTIRKYARACSLTNASRRNERLELHVHVYYSVAYSVEVTLNESLPVNRLLCMANVTRANDRKFVL